MDHRNRQDSPVYSLSASSNLALYEYSSQLYMGEIEAEGYALLDYPICQYDSIETDVHFGVWTDGSDALNVGRVFKQFICNFGISNQLESTPQQF